MNRELLKVIRIPTTPNEAIAASIFLGAVALAPHLYNLCDSLLKLPLSVMANGYEVELEKGDFKLHLWRRRDENCKADK